MKMKFDFMGIVFMIVAILAGNWGGAYLSSFIGVTGGLIGAFLVGFVIYAVFALLTGMKLDMMQGAIFAVLVYVSGIVTATISSMTGFGGGVITLLMQAVVISAVWGYFGKGKQESPVKV